MRVSIGHVFTGTIIEKLRNKGFFFYKDPNPSESYQSYCCSLTDSKNHNTYFEIRQVIDEEAYFRQFHVESFEPFEMEGNLSIPKQVHSNTVNYFVKSLNQQDFVKSNIQQYFRIRKYSLLWALHLQCDNFETFVSHSRPDLLFKYESQDAGVIHLNPSCFDLLVTKRPGL